MTTKKPSAKEAAATPAQQGPKAGLRPALPARVAEAALSLGEAPADLLDWKEYPNGEIALILHNGQKFIVWRGADGQP